MNAAQVGDEVFPWVNEHLNANTQVGIAARIVSRWSQDWHREQYDPEVYKHHENDILDLRDTITSLLAERDQLRETLAFAAQYKGIEARACPLCVYENGKFVEACQMHRDMEALRLQLIGLQTEYDRLNSLQSSTLLESQQKDWTIAELRQQVTQQDKDWLAMLRAIAELEDGVSAPDEWKWGDADDEVLWEEFDPWNSLRVISERLRQQLEEAQAGWETVPEGVYPCDCTVDDCKRSLGVQHRAGGGIRLILRDGISIKAYVVQDDMRLQRRTESEG